HGGDDLACGFGIIAGHQIFSAMLALPKFEIGHVNINDVFHPANAFEAVVGRGVVNKRQTKPAPDTDHERFENLPNKMLGRDEVDVWETNSLQIEHDVRKLRSVHFPASAKLAGLEILAEDAAQIAPAEENRARAVPAA